MEFLYVTMTWEVYNYLTDVRAQTHFRTLKRYETVTYQAKDVAFAKFPQKNRKKTVQRGSEVRDAKPYAQSVAIVTPERADTCNHICQEGRASVKNVNEVNIVSCVKSL